MTLVFGSHLTFKKGKILKFLRFILLVVIREFFCIQGVETYQDTSQFN